MGDVRWIGWVSLLVVFGLVWGCADKPGPTDLEATGMSGAEAVQVGSSLLRATSDAEVFARELARIDYGNELLIVLKDASEPGASLERFQRPDAQSIVGLPDRDAATFTRERPFARAGEASRKSVVDALEAVGAEVLGDLGLPIIQVRFPDEVRKEALSLLLRHPNVDYFEAHRPVEIVFDGVLPAEPANPFVSIPAEAAGPNGSNPLGLNHTFHRVADTDPGIGDAWDHSRGAGVTIGVLDSGFSLNHSDGQGITKRGFVLRYPGCDTTKQASGLCFADDDHTGSGGIVVCLEEDPECCDLEDPECCDPDDPDCEETLNAAPSGHGTQMAGLVGATDNNINTVGVAPDANVISMKISCHLAACGKDILPGDVVAAVTWARNNGVDILSMSWTLREDPGTLFHDALRDAWAGGNGILLLSSTGNENDENNKWPQVYSFVMGVGGLDNSGNSIKNNGSEEIAALSGGSTLSKTGSFTYASGEGATSASTANAAGIAALVMSANPGMNAAAVRNRLVATRNPNGSNALRALLAVAGFPPPFSVDIEGDFEVRDYYTCTWTAEVTGGLPPYTYEWYRDGVLVEQDEPGPEVELDTEEEFFELEVRVVDSLGAMRIADEGISVSPSHPICEGGIGS